MVYRDATLSLSYFERYVVCHKCHHLSNDLCANVISPGFLKSFLTIPYFWELKLYRNNSWLPNQMISLVLIFGFLCRSSIFRYPDDLRNIVQQCARRRTASCSRSRTNPPLGSNRRDIRSLPCNTGHWQRQGGRGMIEAISSWIESNGVSGTDYWVAFRKKPIA